MNVSEELQRFLYAQLRTVPEVATLAEGRVYDRVPSQNGRVTAQFPYVSFGPVNVIDDFADCIDGETHTIQLDVWSREVGQVECKNIVDGIRKALNRSQPELAESAVVAVNIPICQIVRDPDGLTTHGIIQVEIMVEVA
ncbi:DUF3168 domain-containing protein [Brucella rhizosphaerae]|uniref:DUF3168 domain-containing protein n=1 Tax=Brucella rhizosphaerae TaxID=571254 RepID=UPI000B97EE26|nr:DUF3168 domain-containing protein [Brucella rhizosphaerae]